MLEYHKVQVKIKMGMEAYYPKDEDTAIPITFMVNGMIGEICKGVWECA